MLLSFKYIYCLSLVTGGKVVFKNPDNPDNIRTIERFDTIGVSGDVTQNIHYVNFISVDSDGNGTLEGSLIVKDFEQLKGLADVLNQAVTQISEKIEH